MHNCHNCDNPVTGDFARVFGNSRNEIKRCPACADMTDIKAGFGARPNAEAGSAGQVSR